MTFDERLTAGLGEFDRMREHYDNADANCAAVMGNLTCPTTPVRRKKTAGDMMGVCNGFEPTF